MKSIGWLICLFAWLVFAGLLGGAYVAGGWFSAIVFAASIGWLPILMTYVSRLIVDF